MGQQERYRYSASGDGTCSRPLSERFVDVIEQDIQVSEAGTFGMSSHSSDELMKLTRRGVVQLANVAQALGQNAHHH
jgi:hypothetical protein